jgi:UDP-N-acetylmuramoyl-L-alanyl-D-glutamate--2,6-diaminopimelate ligase
MKATLADRIKTLGLADAVLGGSGRPIEWITADSRTLRPGCLFVCMPSASRDTHEFLPEAAEKGAVAAVVHSAAGRDLANSLRLDWVMWSSEPRSEFFRKVALLAHEVLGQPSKQMRVIGVTGTNGKTTTAWMIRDALRSMGRKAAYMGTLGIDFTGDRVELANTTPFPIETAQLMADAVAAGCQDFVMETSSHALSENRVAGILYDAAVFTNLTQDHLDFHGTMDSYENAKKLLFTKWAGDAREAGKKFVGAVNLDDATGRRWAEQLTDVITFGGVGKDGVGALSALLGEADLSISAPEIGLDTIRLVASLKDGEASEAVLRVGGLFNVQNAGSALAGLLALGHSLPEAMSALRHITAVPGRFQAIPNDKKIGVIVDYAHTPDALEQLLKSVRALEPNRIITVFGCGGDRDKTKRPKMAAVVSRLSNVTVVTSDNPRTEDPQGILNDVLAGVQEGADSVDIIDRRSAIFHAVNIAQPHDVVVIAGKGHEDYQIIGRTKHHMDDCEMAAEALEAK